MAYKQIHRRLCEAAFRIQIPIAEREGDPQLMVGAILDGNDPFSDALIGSNDSKKIDAQQLCSNAIDRLADLILIQQGGICSTASSIKDCCTELSSGLVKASDGLIGNQAAQLIVKNIQDSMRAVSANAVGWLKGV